MIIVRFKGGLGNQMFQYAFGTAYAKQHGCEVLFDKSWYGREQNAHPRPLRIIRYAVNIRFATKEQSEQCIDKRRVSRLPGFARKFLKKKKYETNIKEECAGVFDPNLLSPFEHAFFEGYFQTERYFANIRKTILADFTLTTPLNAKNQETLDEIQGTNAVSIHIRRGDYLHLQEAHPICSMEYYQAAVEKVAQSVNNPHFFIFSDDPDWVKRKFVLAHDKTVVDNNDEADGIFDIELMRRCQHNIIANSSFSWWGAWLNENPEKIVIAPQGWFAGRRETDIVPSNWITF